MYGRCHCVHYRRCEPFGTTPKEDASGGVGRESFSGNNRPCVNLTPNKSGTSFAAMLGSYETTVLMDANGTEILIDVTATLDRETRELTLILVALDAATRWYPEDPLVRLLYPNDGAG